MLLIVAVCIVSAAIGAGIALIAKQGPEGPAGPKGATGAEGPPGEAGTEYVAEEALEEAGDVQNQAFELEERIEQLESNEFADRNEAEDAQNEARDAQSEAEAASNEAEAAYNYAESVCSAASYELPLTC